MIPAEYYYDVYLIIISLFTFIIGQRYANHSPNWWANVKADSIIYVLTFTILISLFIGYRPVSDVFADMVGYVNAVEQERYDLDGIEWSDNYLFVPLMYYLSSVIHVSSEIAMLVLAAIYFGASMIATSKIFPKHKLFAMVVFCGAFFTFSGATNGMKAGCSTTLFLCAVAYYENKYLSLFFLFASLGFHHAAQLLIAVYIICRLYKNYRVYLYVWGVSLLIAALHITYFQHFFGSITDDQGAGYLLIEATDVQSGFGGRTGFRFDFILYSVVPILLGYYSIFEKNITSKFYIFMLNVYTLSNAIWMLCMYAPFTNRIASLGWGLYSILILYPVLQSEWHKEKNNVVLMAAYCHLGFTLIMHLIYY